jgi:hypothetical protein
MYADGDRIWMIGTKRLLSGGDNKLDAMIQAQGHWWDSVIYGDFAVCPLTPDRPGHLQTVCIQSYKNIKIAKRP